MSGSAVLPKYESPCNYGNQVQTENSEKESVQPMNIDIEATVAIESEPKKLSISVSATYLLAALLPKEY